MKSLIFNFLTEETKPGYTGVINGDDNVDPLKIINFVIILFLIMILYTTICTIFLNHKINKLKNKGKQDKQDNK